MKLRIVSGFRGHVQDWLLRGKVDLGVAYEGQKSPRSDRADDSRTAFPDPAAEAAGARRTPITTREALTVPLILPNAEHGLRGRVEAIAQAERRELDVVLEIDVLSSMLAFVSARHGKRPSCRWSASSTTSAQGSSSPARSPTCPRPDAVLMSPLNRPASRLSREFSEFLEAEVHHMVDSGAWPGTTL